MYEDDIKVDATVVRVDMTEPQNYGDMPKIVIKFRYEKDGRECFISHYRSFTDKALPYTEADLVTLGWDPTRNGWAIDDLISDNQPIAGKECSLVLGWDDYDPNQPRLKVKFVNERGGGGVKNKASVESAAAFAALLRKKVGMSAPAGAKRPAPAKQQPPKQPTADVGAVDSDGIPF